jgi:hypothetical protein
VRKLDRRRSLQESSPGRGTRAPVLLVTEHGSSPGGHPRSMAARGENWRREARTPGGAGGGPGRPPDWSRPHRLEPSAVPWLATTARRLPPGLWRDRESETGERQRKRWLNSFFYSRCLDSRETVRVRRERDRERDGYKVGLISCPLSFFDNYN